MGLLINIVAVCLIVGFLIWAIRQLPFIAEPYKTIAIVGIIVIGVLIFLGYIPLLPAWRIE